MSLKVQNPYNGEVIREVNMVAMIDIVNGEDRMEKHRQAIGV